ncbi:hypothetical protein C8R43DRAFT_887459 [Mycena crocata]|nr:hypothetical protein C8R43DRAFT_887459 [Mycena crocata]
MGNQDFPLERSWYIGNIFFAILYGIHICMFFLSVHYLNIGFESRKLKIAYIAYSVVLMVLLTIALSSNLFLGQSMWIEGRDSKGGPAVYFAENVQDWYNTMGSAADITANGLADGLMLYRLYIFWGHLPAAMVLPALLYMGSVAMGISTTVQSGLPGHNLFHGVTVNFGIPWLVLTIVFNILVTAMICARLISMRSNAMHILGASAARKYTGRLAILVESACPFTILGMVYLGTYAKQVPESLALADIWGACVLSPQAIILRVAMGVAWTQDGVECVSSSSAIDLHVP